MGSISESNYKRLISLDVMRGAIMILLAGESAGLYRAASNFELQGLMGMLVGQFFHHPWHGFRFWDMVQPAFMYIAGVALYISYDSKTRKGITWKQNYKHILIRCLKLFLLGVALHCVFKGKLVWELWNVLTQLAVTTVIAYLIIRSSYLTQLAWSFGLLLLAELLYRYMHIPGYDQPFVKDQNFGSWFDMLVMGKLNPGGGWVAINVITTAAHTIWGSLTGKLISSHLKEKNKMRIMIIAGLSAVALGFSLDAFGVTPIIKRIATSSFVLYSGGWVILIMAFLYWLVDLKNNKRLAWIFVIVGMNSIFIYMFFETVGSQWLNKTVGIFIGGFAGLLWADKLWQSLLTAGCSLFVLWYICLWLYKKKIFFKL